jgi:hypothetical protein
MKKALGVFALMMASACSYYQNPSDADAAIVRPGSFKAGSGVISAISVLRNQNSGRADPNLYRLSLQMDAGGFQTVDIDSNAFFVGEAVELTNDGRILHVSGTTLRSPKP